MHKDVLDPVTTEDTEPNLGPTPIQRFYDKANIFLTGGTGFIGILLLEKLLVSCPGISKIYMLVRPKKGKSVQTRLDELFEGVIFSRVRSKCPSFKEKIIPVEGDCELPQLGLGLQQQEILKKEVHIVFHVAATVRFDEGLKKACFINVRGVRDVVRLAHQMANLKSFVHVSTAYSNCINDFIKEEVYPPPIHYNELLKVVEVLPDGLLATITPQLLGKFPNTYTYTKQIGEDVVKREGKGLPIGIHRPSIVISTYKEPLKGWVNNVYGAAGLLLGSGLGIIRVLQIRGDLILNYVPADMVVNSIIASAWDITSKSKDSVPVYNYESSPSPDTNYDDYMRKARRMANKYYSVKGIWTVYSVSCESDFGYTVATFFLHTIPGLLADAVLYCLGKQPMMTKIYRKIHNMNNALVYFAMKGWEFESSNTRHLVEKMSNRDKAIFYSDMKYFNWDTFIDDYALGMRAYLAQDPVDTLEEGQRKLRKLTWIDWIMKVGCRYCTRSNPDPVTTERNLDPTPIQRFYDKANIFLTGGTGFIGILLLEKLLVSCPGISKIYILVRPKKGKSVQTRLDELFEDVVFSRVRSKCPSFKEKFIPVEGDCELPQLGLGLQQQEILKKEVHIVFHVAATVRFDEGLKKACFINVRGVRDVVRLAHQMANLKSFVHVSTAYSNCINDFIKEEVYPPPIHYNELLKVVEVLPDGLLATITPQLLGKFPNTYTYTKQIGEDVVKREGKGLPIGIHRPSIVISTYKEPLKGWVNNMYGPAGLELGTGLGIIRVLQIRGDLILNYVPADMVVNSIIASAWDITSKSKDSVPVYNYESSPSPDTNYDDYIRKAKRMANKYYSVKGIWTVYSVSCESDFGYTVATFFLHTIPGLLADAVLYCLGKEPMMTKIYRKIHNMNNALVYFTTKGWEFESSNTRHLVEKMSNRDKAIFYSDMKYFNWDTFIDDYALGMRAYVAQDPVDTLEEGQRKLRKLTWINWIMKVGCRYCTRSNPDPVTTERNLDPTPIQRFYDKATIFLTGGTGFLGILLLEKLLVSCPGISKIYMLVRPKKGKSVQTRLDELFEDVVFSRVRSKCPSFKEKIIPVEGDCELPQLGLGLQQQEILKKEVDVVFHVAATVRFDEGLKRACFINIRGVRDILRLAHQMANLKSFVHVSTAYSNCINDFIKEEIYSPPMDYNKLLKVVEVLPDDILTTITPLLQGRFPNTYTYTKQLGEDVVRRESKGLPIGIHRPSIVLSTYKEPLEGWTNNVYGPAGLALGGGLGFVRVIQVATDVVANFVPADMVVNSIIASACDVADRSVGGSPEEVPVYNYEGSPGPDMTYETYINKCLLFDYKYFSVRAMWYTCIKVCESRLGYIIATFFLHTVPGAFGDAVLYCLGKRPMMLKIYRKLHKMNHILTYFSLREWSFESNNTRRLVKNMSDEDRRIFFCDMKDVDWDEYLELYVLGLRQYLAKDPLDTLEAGQKKLRRFYWLHQTVKAVLVICLLGLVRYLYLSISSI
ncbi:hypothetical protein NQ315_006439 [Exocentrus adspersus]|uniref:Fatty acyl-CoA reductase n=1 Tax=Exocentrus adspersus TaxID=1586481 RepID=A0AAV8W1H8_9CUCU|nr:hypothetical protein NQ315_006439 [Exocentrus adspersus]